MPASRKKGPDGSAMNASPPRRIVKVILAAVACVLVAGCGAPEPTVAGPRDHADLVAAIEIGLDAPSSGPAGYRVDLTVRALSDDASESYAWAGHLTIRFVASDAATRPGIVSCRPDVDTVSITQPVVLASFRNNIGAGEHWHLPISVQHPGFGDGHYTVTVTAAFGKTGTTQSDVGEFSHCAAT